MSVSKNNASHIKPVRDPKTFKELQSLSVYVNLLSKTEVNGITRSVFKIIVEDNITHHKFIGYSLEKSKTSIDVFVNYVLSNLEMRNGLDKNFKLLTGKVISDQDQDSDLKKEKKHQVIKGTIDHKEILSIIYSDLIFNEGYAEVEGYSESKNPLLPPLFVDAFISEFDKIVKFTDYWRNQKAGKKDNKILLDALEKAGKGVERYQNEFDFEKALKFYNRLNSAAAELAESEKLSAQFVLKQVKINFHLEQYDKCKDLIDANMQKIEQYKLYGELGEFFYYLGMIEAYSNRITDAETYFSRSTRLLMKSDDPERKFIFYNSRIRRLILTKNFDKAIAVTNEALRYTARKGNENGLAYLYSLKAEIYVRYFKYELALEALDLQLDHARKCNDPFSESKCIAQIFSVRSYINLLEDEKALELLRRVKKLSGIINKTSHYYDALISLAIHFYQKNKENEAEIYFKKALSAYTEKTTDAASHIVNMIYLSMIRIHRKNYLGAVILLNKMLRLCDVCSVTVYPAYIQNALGRTYYEQLKHKTSNHHFAKAVRQIIKDKINDTVLKANTYAYIGLNNVSLNKHKIALNYLNKSLALYLKHNSSAKSKEIAERIDFLKSKIAEMK